jgi:hypothetical protein
MSKPTTQITLSPIFKGCTAAVEAIGAGLPATVTTLCSKMKRKAGLEFLCGPASQNALYEGVTTLTAKTTGIGNPVGIHVG